MNGRRLLTWGWALVFLFSSAWMYAQEVAAVGASSEPTVTSSSTAAVPRLIKYSGRVADARGEPVVSVAVRLTFAVYEEQQGGAAIWAEAQTVQLDEQGHYNVLLGATRADGLPGELFPAGKVRWLGVQVEGRDEDPRVLLVSVPYALKAEDAAMLGGRRASDFVLSEQLKEEVKAQVEAQKPGIATQAMEMLLTNPPSLPAIAEGPSTFTCATTGDCVNVTQSGTGRALRTTATSTTEAILIQQNGTGYGLRALVPGNVALVGQITGSAGTSYGVKGQTTSTTGAGVFGYNLAPTGLSYGILGQTQSTGGTALFGRATALTGATIGLRGHADSTSGTGIMGQATATSGTTAGIVGRVFSPDGIALIADNSAAGGMGGKILSARSYGVEKFGIDASGNLTVGGQIEVSGYVSATGSISGTDGSFSGSLSSDGNLTVSGDYLTAKIGSFTANTAEAGVGISQGGSGYGLNASSSGGIAVRGSAPTHGIEGRGTDSSGITYGVTGQVWSADGTGVKGFGGGTGVYGSGSQYGVQGITDTASGTVYGVQGTATLSASGIGVGGTGKFAGVKGYASGSSGKVFGVYATADVSAEGVGVYGNGVRYGVVGESSDAAGNGVLGRGKNAGVKGEAMYVWPGVVYGVYGDGGTTPDGIGVMGIGMSAGVKGSNTSTSGAYPGVLGEATSSASGIGVKGTGPYQGVVGTSTGVSGWGYGVYGSASGSTTSVGVYGTGTQYAGYFNGDVHITGTLSKGSGSFKIDHPLDPADKYLSHSFVESPDMKNVYDGVAILNAQGEAWVSLPEWFGALNRDFRYQLTAIGCPQPKLYIAEEISANRFKIAGGKSAAKVSWQVTGIRQDAYARAHRIAVEEEKPAAARGFYLHPELFGQPAAKSIDWARRPEEKRTPQKERGASFETAAHGGR